MRDKICFSFATTSTLLTAEAWEQGFPETDLITIITPDECLTLRFDTKLEHMEWVETLGKLWQAKYSQEELKAKNKLRQVNVFLNFSTSQFRVVTLTSIDTVISLIGIFGHHVSISRPLRGQVSPPFALLLQVWCSSSPSARSY